MTSLYQMTAEFRKQVSELENSDMDHETIADTIESMQYPIEIKGANVAAYALTLDAEINALKEVEGKVAAKRKSRENAAKRLREYLKNNMRDCGITEIKSLDGTFTAKLYPERDSVVVIDCKASVPIEFWRKPLAPPPEPDKSLIRQMINDGYEVPGAHLQKNDRLTIG